jgi:hypothetical protein
MMDHIQSVIKGIMGEDFFEENESSGGATNPEGQGEEVKN